MEKIEAELLRAFGTEVRRLRIERGLTLEGMQDFGFSAQHFQKIEAGKKSIGLYTAYRIATAFDLTMGEFFRNISIRKR